MSSRLQAADPPAALNVLYNGLQPVDLTKLPQVFGVLEYVTAEVFVSYMCRWLFKTLPQYTRSLFPS